MTVSSVSADQTRLYTGFSPNIQTNWSEKQFYIYYVHVFGIISFWLVNYA